MGRLQKFVDAEKRTKAAEGLLGGEDLVLAEVDLSVAPLDRDSDDYGTWPTLRDARKGGSCREESKSSAGRTAPCVSSLQRCHAARMIFENFYVCRIVGSAGRALSLEVLLCRA